MRSLVDAISFSTDYLNMIWMLGLVVFGIYLSTWFTDELVFHRRRRPGQRERWGLWLDLTFLLACFGVALGLGYSETTQWVFAIPATLSVLLITRPEWRPEYRSGFASSGSEGGTHALKYLLHIPVILVLGMFWPFAHGVSFMMGVVLPFSTNGIWEVVLAGAVLTSVLWFYQIVQLIRGRRNVPEVTPLQNQASEGGA